MATALELAKAVVSVGMDTSRLRKDLQDVKRETEAGLNEVLSGLKGMLGQIGLALGGGAFAATGISIAGRAEQVRVALEVMLGSAKDARRVLSDLFEFAASTPFEMPELSSAARQLLMMGESIEGLLPTLTMLGNAAAGASADLDTIVYAFNKVRATSKMTLREFYMLANAGVLSLSDLARYTGWSMDEVMSKISRGEFTFEMLKGVFASLSSEGGRYFKMMERQGETLFGRWSTFQDNFNLFARTVMESVLPALKELLRIGDVLLGLLNKVFGNRTVQIITAFVMTLLAVKAAITAISAAVRGLTMVGAIAKAALGGPAAWASLAAGIVAGASAVVLLNREFEKIDQSAQSVNKNIKDTKVAIEETGTEAVRAREKVRYFFEEMSKEREMDWGSGEAVDKLFEALRGAMRSPGVGKEAAFSIQELVNIDVRKRALRENLYRLNQVSNKYRERLNEIVKSVQFYLQPEAFNVGYFGPEEAPTEEKLERFLMMRLEPGYTEEQLKKVSAARREYKEVLKQFRAHYELEEEARKSLANLAKKKGFVERWREPFLVEEEQAKATEYLAYSLNVLAKATPQERMAEFLRYLEKIAPIAGWTASQVQKVAEAFRKEVFGESYAALEELRKRVENLRQGLTKTQEELRRFAETGATPEMLEQFKRLKEEETVLEFRKQIDKVKQSIEDLQEGTEEWQKRFREMVKGGGVPLKESAELYKLLEREDQLRRLREDSKRIIEDTKTEAERAQEEVERIMSAYREGFLTGEQAERALKKLQNRLAESQFNITGFVGFEDWGRRLQEAFLQERDPQELLVKIGEKQVSVLESIDASLREVKNKEAGVLASP